MQIYADCLQWELAVTFGYFWPRARLLLILLILFAADSFRDNFSVYTCMFTPFGCLTSLARYLPTSQELVAHNIQGRSSVVFDLPKLPCHHNLDIDQTCLT